MTVIGESTLNKNFKHASEADDHSKIDDILN